MVQLKDSHTVCEVAGRWLAIYVPNARTGKNVGMAAQRMRDYVIPFMGDRSIGSLRPDDIRAHRLWLANRGLAPRMVRHLLTDVRCMLNWAVEAEILSRSPFPKRVMPRIQEAPPDRLSDDEISVVLRVPEPHGFVIRFGLATGMRWGEMCRATAAHLEGTMIVVAQTKSTRIRRIPVPHWLQFQIFHREGRLVPFTEGSAGSFSKVVRRHSGLAGFHVHQLRHTFACRWIESGGSLPALQQILGHASIVTTQQYARLSDESVQREAARINGATNVG